MNKVYIVQVFAILCVIIEVNNAPMNTTYSYKFCKGNRGVFSSFEPGLDVGYRVIIIKKLAAASSIRIKLDSEGSIRAGGEVFSAQYAARLLDIDLINNVFSFVVLKDYDKFVFTVKGKHYPHPPPYILSLKINGVENCWDPDRLYFQKSFPDVIQLWSAAPDKFCGRRKILNPVIELIVHGTPTKAGNWPWHAAIYRRTQGLLKYNCGGTLISKFSILTAAHCATENGVPINPEVLGVILGKFSLKDTEVTNQQKQVYDIIVHDEYGIKTFNNDIALLKLTTEAIFNNYVQPACIWFDGVYDKLDSYEVVGTVTGWGIDQSDILSNELREATVPIVPSITCILYEPTFYRNMLNENKFCGGQNNGTAACNGDSGGGLVIFVKDEARESYDTDQGVAGAWYVRGIVSITLARKDSDICDPEAYTVFTDVAKHREWILHNMK